MMEKIGNQNVLYPMPVTVVGAIVKEIFNFQVLFFISMILWYHPSGNF